MENEIKSRWGEIIAYLKDNSSISGPAIRTFIEPLEAISYENNILTLQIDMSQQGDCYKALTERYYFDIRVAVESIIEGEEIAQINFVYKKDDSVSSYFNEEKEQSLIDKYPYLSQGHSFETFVTSQSNARAYAAALNVAENPTLHVYNPLFLYGNPGLGKTHLMHSIARHIIEHHPELKVLYITSEDFTNQVIEAIRSNKVSHDNSATTNLRKKFRSVDVLLIDDIQFLAGKESTQEEFFHTFNTLHNAGKQIVLASDRPAKEIKSLEERLRTRFEWGLTADIQPPDFETRVAIVKRKAELLNLDLPDDVAEYIANHLKQNIRQLEGAVKKLNAYYMLEGIAPCIGVTTTAIKDTLNDTQPIPVTIEKIINEVARTYNVIPSDIRGKKRSANVSAARQMSMYIIREITGMSMEAIGSEFQRDHSTVVYSINTMEKNIGKDRHLKETVDDIMKNIRA